MRVVTHHGLADLRSDLRTIQRQAPRAFRTVVLRNVRAGNNFAKNLARQANDADSHSRKYPGTFGPEMHGGRGLFGNTYSGEFGPRHAGQGMLAPILENGSRSGNAAQHNLARAADVIGPRFAGDVLDTAADFFWPES